MSSVPGRSSRKARLAAALIIICLVALTSVIVYETSLLGWPFASGKLGGIFGPPAHNSLPPNGTLTVQVSSVQVTPSGNISSPIQNAFVQVFPGQSVLGIPVISNYTSPSGILEFLLVPAQYTVKVTNTMANFTPPVPLIVKGNLTTVLTVNLTTTTYAASFFDIVNPASTSVLPTWSPIYVQIESPSKLPVATDTVYLSIFVASVPLNNSLVFATPVNGTIGVSSTAGLQISYSELRIRIANQILSPNMGTLLVQLNLDSPTNLAGVQQMSILTVGSSTSWYIYNVTSDQTVTLTTT